MLEKTLESPLDFKEVQPVHPKRDQPWILIGRTDAAAEAPILWLPDAKTDLLEKSLVLEKIEGRRRRGWQRMRWLDDITDSVDMIFGKLQAMVSDMEVWHAIIHGVAKSQTWLGDWTTTYMYVCVCVCVCIYIYKTIIFLLRFFPLIGHYKILSLVLCAIQ